jgi:hypothetical protein
VVIYNNPVPIRYLSSEVMLKLTIGSEVLSICFTFFSLRFHSRIEFSSDEEIRVVILEVSPSASVLPAHPLSIAIVFLEAKSQTIIVKSPAEIQYLLSLLITKAQILSICPFRSYKCSIFILLMI